MQHCFCNSYFCVIFQVLFWVRSEYDTFLFTAHLYIKQFSFNNRVIIVADLTPFYKIIDVSSSINLNRKNKRKKIKLKRILGLCQSNTFLPNHVHACVFVFVFCTFCQFNNLWVKLFLSSKQQVFVPGFLCEDHSGCRLHTSAPELRLNPMSSDELQISYQHNFKFLISLFRGFSAPLSPVLTLHTQKNTKIKK